MILTIGEGHMNSDSMDAMAAACGRLERFADEVADPTRSYQHRGLSREVCPKGPGLLDAYKYGKVEALARMRGWAVENGVGRPGGWQSRD